MIAVQIMAAVVAVWLLGNASGWFFVFGRKGAPLSWRIVLGPGAYINWLRVQQPNWWRDHR